MQRGLVSERAADDRLLALAAYLHPVEPGGPPGIQDARHADLVLCFVHLWTVGADAGAGRHPKVACEWNLAVMARGSASLASGNLLVAGWPDDDSQPLSRRRAAWRHQMTDSGTLPRDEPTGQGGRSSMADPAAAPPAGAAMSGQDVLLATKLHVPRPQPGFVPRQRLVQALGEGLARGRVLVCAPAGSGKTALLADWARGSGRPVAWLGLDGGDSDPARFWRYVVAALDRARPGLAGRMGPLPPRSFEGLVTALINELAADPGPDQLLLVLDDYHLVDSGPVHESVAFLLENLPPSLRVVVSGRADPPLPLARLRARGQLAELRAADLRFTDEEATALLGEAAGPGLPGTAVTALVARTEGWAAGLQLAGLSQIGEHT